MTDPTGEPLIGVSIILKGTTRGTVTDIDGTYSLSINEPSATLIFSYTGFKTLEQEVSAGAPVADVTLSEDIAKLEEVVVTGLASGVKRANSGNAVTSVTGEELTGTTAPQTLDNALFGKILGVNMSANSGAPGGGINMQLRGISTLGAGSSQPLFIIDGVYVDNSSIRTGWTQVSGASGGQNANTQDQAANRIADINPDDIEKIEILKGPSAAAIYGTRANAGVVIITTKRGNAGKTNVSLSQDIGFAKGQNFVGFSPWTEEKVMARFSGDREAVELEKFREAEQQNRFTDWEEFFYGETPILSNTQLSINGGNQKTQFFVSTGIQAIATNAADLENRGFELALGINPVRSNNFNWFTKLLYWQNRSEITDLQIPTQTVGGFGPALGTYMIAEGFSPTAIVGTPADPSTPSNFTLHGDRQPDFQMSWLNEINFLGNFDLNFLLHWQNGGDAINLSALLWDLGWTAPDCVADAEGNYPCRQRLGSFNGGAYAAVKTANVLIEAAQNSTNLTTEEANATVGFGQMIKGYQLLWPLMQQWDNGIRVDVEEVLNPGPTLSRTEALGAIRDIMDQSYDALTKGGSALPFELTTGWAGFNTPQGLAQVNRAIAARLALYDEDWQGALNALDLSFMDMEVDETSSDKMNIGPAHVYGESPDINNPLFYPFDRSTNTILLPIRL